LLLIDRTQIIDANCANVLCTPLLAPSRHNIDGLNIAYFLGAVLAFCSFIA
jgi:hypothetical protein